MTLKKKKLIRLLLISLIAGCMLLAAAVYFHQEIPGFDLLTEAVTGRGIFGTRAGEVEIRAVGGVFHVNAYRARVSGENGTVVFLAGVPGPEDSAGRYNLKVGNNYLACFNDGGGRWFLPTPVGMIAGESAAVSYGLEDGTKGWDAEYRITDRGKALEYRISAPGTPPREIEFTLPKAYFGDVPTVHFPDGKDRVVAGNTITVLPSRMISKQLNGWF